MSSTDAGDCERVNLCPSPPTHAGRNNTNPDMLACTPPSIDIRYFNASCNELGKRTDESPGNPGLSDTEKVIEAIKSNACEDIRHHGGHVEPQLRMGSVIPRPEDKLGNKTYGRE